MNFVDGTFVETAESFAVVNPFTGEKIGEAAAFETRRRSISDRGRGECFYSLGKPCGVGARKDTA